MKDKASVSGSLDFHKVNEAVAIFFRESFRLNVIVENSKEQNSRHAGRNNESSQVCGKRKQENARE